MVKLSVISQREVEDTLQDFEKRRYLILSALRAQKNLSTAAFFTKRERSSKVSSTSLWRPVHRLFIHAFVLGSIPVQTRKWSVNKVDTQRPGYDGWSIRLFGRMVYFWVRGIMQ